jgi:hypothetical protein
VTRPVERRPGLTAARTQFGADPAIGPPFPHTRAVARRIRPLVLLCAVLLALALVACTGDTPSGNPTSGQPRSGAQQSRPVWPLTGLSVDRGTVKRRHPVYIVKIDNTVASAPQTGLGHADLVTEELVEGGITRLAAFYYSALPKRVGPVRSMRHTDIGIAKPVDGHLVASGAAPITLRGLGAAGVRYVDMSNPHVVRVNDGVRDSLHSVMADLAAVGRDARGKASRPVDYFPWKRGALKGGTPAITIRARLSSARTSTWDYRKEHYRLANGYMPEGDEFRARTVIACRVRTSVAPYRDPAGSIVPMSHFEGSGKAWIFNRGRAVQATWHKKREGSPVTFTKGGTALELPPGRVWLELIPGRGPIPAGAVSWSK